MNKPIYLGQSILDISKTLIYEFCYGYLKPKYDDKIKLCYSDTDSFVIQVKQKIHMVIFLLMLKNSMIFLIMIKMIIDLFQ